MLLLKTILINIGVAAAYFSAGYIGNLLSLDSSSSSPVWPAAGLALAVMLIYGRRIVAGLFVGVFFTQLHVSFGWSVFEAIDKAFWLIFVQTVASTFQAIVGMLLIHRFVGKGDALLDLSKVLQFFFYGALVSCLIAPTISIGNFYIHNVLTFDDCMLAWLTWWVGDVIGVLIFTPIILTFIANPKSVWRPRIETVAAPLCLLLVMLFYIFLYNTDQENKRVSLLFDSYVERVLGEVESEINGQKLIAENFRDIFSRNSQIVKNEFELMVSISLQQYPDIQSVEWIPRIINKSKLSTTANKNHFPTQYIESYLEGKSGLERAIIQSGISLMTLEQALVTGKVLSTGVISLEGGLASVNALSIMYAPVIRNSQYLGVVAIVFSVKNNKADAVSALVKGLIRVEIKNNKNIYYSNFAKNEKKAISFIHLEAIKTIEVAGVSWSISTLPSEQFISTQTNWHVWWTLLGGLILTCFIGVGLLVLTGRTAHITAQVKIKTRDLSNINNRLNQQIQLRKKLEEEQISRNEILEGVAKGIDFKDILFNIVRNTEKINPEMICSILLLDEKGMHLNKGVSIRLPSFYSEALEGVQIGEGVGSCGTAAFTGKRVIVENIMTHPYWASFKGLAKSAHLYACWSEPVLSSKGKVLGTFAIYYEQPKAPKQKELDFIKRMADLTAITVERKQAEDELKIAAITFQSHDAVVITDVKGIILRVNQAYKDITGYSENELLGKEASALDLDEHDQNFIDSFYSELAEKGRWEGEIWSRRKNGEHYPKRLVVTAVSNSSEITHYVSIFSDISDKKAKEEKIKQLAFYDSLTLLPNRRLLLERLDQAIVMTNRNKHFGAVIYMDLDHFKMLNDGFGHQVGDELLIQVAARINSVIREEDTACRIGGDEFVVLITGYNSTLKNVIKQSSLVAEKIRDKINEPFELGLVKQVFSVSIGVSVFPDVVNEPVEILEQADTAMYRSKQSGRNRVSFFSSQMQDEHNRKASLERMLLTALSANQFVMYYQGQATLNGEVVTAEALLRWEYPLQEMVSPAEFIPIAETSHLIVDIGDWVVSEVCMQIKKWQNSGLYLEHVAINISPRQFRQENFVKKLQDAINHADIDAKHVMLELTEGIVIEDIKDTINKMLQIKMMGISISIDDFGTGYSSLTYLKQLPLTQLKIDQSFVKDINIDTSDEVIVESIIALAHKLGLEVIAEGVETKEQLQFLEEKGCNKYQGYYFCKPATAEHFFNEYGS